MGCCVNQKPREPRPHPKMAIWPFTSGGPWPDERATDSLGVVIERVAPGDVLWVRAGDHVERPARPVVCAYCGTSRAGDVARCESCGATEGE
jgi:hypothetical protein